MRATWIGIVWLMCLTMVGCQDDAAERGPNIPHTEASLTQLGPYTVGLRRTIVRYLPPGEDQVRSLQVLVWYPSTEKPPEGAHKSEVLLADFFPITNTDSYDDLPLAQSDARPFAIYSHGSGGDSGLAYPIVQQFASRGWIVAAPAHTGNTTATLDSEQEINEQEMSILRPLDISAVIDAATDGFDFEGFEGAMDVEHTFLFGHSFGGFTSLAIGGATYSMRVAREAGCDDPDSRACTYLHDPDVEAAVQKGFRDPRVVAIGLQAPGTLNILDPAGVQVPALMLTGDRDQTLPKETNADPIWAGLHNPDDLWVRFANAGHYSFIRVCDDLGFDAIAAFMPDSVNDGCSEDFLSPSKVVQINTAYLVAFAESHVLGVDAWTSFLDGTDSFAIAKDADLTMTTHASP